jgi:hypothetical protein
MKAETTRGGWAVSVLVLITSVTVAARAEQPGQMKAQPAAQIKHSTLPCDQKLDLILEKLDKLEKRMQQVEAKLSADSTDSPQSCVDIDDLLQWFQSLLGIQLINTYSSDPNRRMQELIDNSKDLRDIEKEWERVWYTDQPSHMTPERVHGGIQ